MAQDAIKIYKDRNAHVDQQDPQHLRSTGMQVSHLARHSGLRIWCLPQLRHRWPLWFSSDPWPGNSTCPVVLRKGEKKTKTKIVGLGFHHYIKLKSSHFKRIN